MIKEKCALIDIREVLIVESCTLTSEKCALTKTFEKCAEDLEKCAMVFKKDAVMCRKYLLEILEILERQCINTRNGKRTFRAIVHLIC